MPDLRCAACGKRFRSMTAEAKHRHNFPALCSRNRQFARFVREHEPARLHRRILCGLIRETPNEDQMHVTPEDGDDQNEVAKCARWLSNSMTRDVDLLVSFDRKVSEAGVITMTMQAPVPTKSDPDDDL